jgi:hypothetical protein
MASDDGTNPIFEYGPRYASRRWRVFPGDSVPNSSCSFSDIGLADPRKYTAGLLGVPNGDQQHPVRGRA